MGIGKDTVQINGKSQHIIGYLQDFLFSPARSRALVKTLSGGEKSRLLLARLFAQPSNLLILDEPTNDLDTETLDLLEEQLAYYKGTVLLISHDRAFLNNVATSTLVFEKNQTLHEYPGGYDDWLAQRSSVIPVNSPAPSAANTSAPIKTRTATSAKLSYKEQRELEKLPDQIKKIEEEQATLQADMHSSTFYLQDKSLIADKINRLEQLTAELTALYDRWAELDGRL